jgi:hypothetical protein
VVLALLILQGRAKTVRHHCRASRS